MPRYDAEQVKKNLRRDFSEDVAAKVEAAKIQHVIARDLADDSIGSHQDVIGVALARCQDAIDNAELRVRYLRDNKGSRSAQLLALGEANGIAKAFDIIRGVLEEREKQAQLSQKIEQLAGGRRRRDLTPRRANLQVMYLEVTPSVVKAVPGSAK